MCAQRNVQAVLLRDAALGYCQGTTFRQVDCSTASSGAWRLEADDLKSWELAALACAARCAACSGCQFISLARRHRDCSWFSRCSLSRLKRAPEGFVSARAVRLPGLSNGSAQEQQQQEALGSFLHVALAAEAAEQDSMSMWASEAQRALVAQKLKWLDAQPRHHPEDHRSSPALLLLGVMSAPDDSARRDCMRDLLRGERPEGLERRFVLGTRQLPTVVAAKLSAEAGKRSDMLLLASAREGHKRFLSEKVLAWFLWAATQASAPPFIGKADMDSMLVWARARPHFARVSSRASEHISIGYYEYVSYNARRARFCGCCGVTLGHGRALQTDPKAFFGPCRAPAAPHGASGTRLHADGHGSSRGGGGGRSSIGNHAGNTAESADDLAREVAGPFAFAQGAFYAWSTGLVQWVATVGRARAEGQLEGLQGRPHTEEDLMMSYLAYMAPNVSGLSLGRAAFLTNYADETIPTRTLGQLRHLCGHSVANWTIGNVTTGTLAGGNPETVIPTALVLHRVGTCGQQRRAWAAAAIWTELIEQQKEQQHVVKPLAQQQRRRRQQQQRGGSISCLVGGRSREEKLLVSQVPRLPSDTST